MTEIANWDALEAAARFLHKDGTDDDAEERLLTAVSAVEPDPLKSRRAISQAKLVRRKAGSAHVYLNFGEVLNEGQSSTGVPYHAYAHKTASSAEAGGDVEVVLRVGRILSQRDLSMAGLAVALTTGPESQQTTEVGVTSWCGRVAFTGLQAAENFQITFGDPLPE